MLRLEFAAEIAAPRDTVWRFYDTIESLAKVTPPQTRVRLLSEPAAMSQGARFLLLVRHPPVYLPLHWETIITEHDPPRRFVDEQGRGPFAFWRHEHDFLETARGHTLLRDTINYEPPLGPLGVLADWLFLHRQLEAMFRYRHAQTRRLLEPKP